MKTSMKFEFCGCDACNEVAKFFVDSLISNDLPICDKLLKKLPTEVHDCAPEGPNGTQIVIDDSEDSEPEDGELSGSFIDDEEAEFIAGPGRLKRASPLIEEAAIGSDSEGSDDFEIRMDQKRSRKKAKASRTLDPDRDLAKAKVVHPMFAKVT